MVAIPASCDARLARCVVPVRFSVAVMVVVSVVLILPAMIVMFVVPAAFRLVMMRLVMVRLFRSLLWRIILFLGLLPGLWGGLRCLWFPAQTVLALRLNRGHPAAAEQAEAACQTLIAGEEGKGALIAQCLQHTGVDRSCIRHIAVRPCNDAIATLL
jgi:hypothetical protein